MFINHQLISLSCIMENNLQQAGANAQIQEATSIPQNEEQSSNTEKVTQKSFVLNRVYHPRVTFTKDETGSICQNIVFNSEQTKKDYVTIMTLNNCTIRVTRENLLAQFSYKTTNTTPERVSNNFYETAGMIAYEIEQGTFNDIIAQARLELREYEQKKRNTWSEKLLNMIAELKLRFPVITEH